MESDWLHLSKDEKGFTYNKYFVDNPNMVIGSMEEVSGKVWKYFNLCFKRK